MITLVEAAKKYLQERTMCRAYSKAAQSLISYGSVHNVALTWDNLQEWMRVGSRPHIKRIAPLSKTYEAFCKTLVRYTNQNGWTEIKIPYKTRQKPEYIRYLGKPMRLSAASSLLNQYVSYRQSANTISENTHQCLRFFNDYCAKNYPANALLTYEMVLSWCQKRKTERPSSYNKRIAPIRSFLKYTNKAGLTNICLPEYLPYEKKKFIPHHFSETELTRFFNAVDCMERGKLPEFAFIIRRMVLPVFFRLLYSTGIRTCEARGLRCEDVDLNNGVLNIVNSKGSSEHRVAMHKTMQTLMVQYDNAISNLLPIRKAFFPNEFGEFLPRTWESHHFNKIWKKISDEPARCYDLRANYAVTNINRWKFSESEWFDKLLYLSRSMGHSCINSTTYYYNLVPLFAEQLRDLSEPGLQEILPNLNEYYNQDHYYEEE